MNLLIRDALPGDIPEILSIYSEYVLHSNYTFEYDVPTIEKFTERFLNITALFPWIVCEIDGKVRGYAYGSRAFERIAYQWDADVTIYIDKEFHGLGIAKRLYQLLHNFLKEQGYYNLYAVITAVNLPSIGFHRSVGYNDIGLFHKTGYKRGEWLDVLWMEKQLRTNYGVPEAPVSYKSLDKCMTAEVFREGSREA